MTLLDRPVTTSRYELRPFWALQELAVGGPEGVKGIVWYLENILLFVPFGYLLSVRNMKMKTVVLIGLITSFCIELIQYATAIGLAELDDLTANTIGAGFGGLLWKLMRKVVESHKK
jgi:glycopeptide antibiotics resistance protein